MIALIADYVFHDDSRVGSALALATNILGPPAWALVRGLRPYGRLCGYGVERRGRHALGLQTEPARAVGRPYAGR